MIPAGLNLRPGAIGSRAGATTRDLDREQERFDKSRFARVTSQRFVVLTLAGVLANAAFGESAGVTDAPYGVCAQPVPRVAMTLLNQAVKDPSTRESAVRTINYLTRQYCIAYGTLPPIDYTEDIGNKCTMYSGYLAGERVYWADCPTDAWPFPRPPEQQPPATPPPDAGKVAQPKAVPDKQPDKQKASNQFDGAWTISWTGSVNCRRPSNSYVIRIHNGIVKSKRMSGRVSATGAARWSGLGRNDYPVAYVGVLKGSAGSGRFRNEKGCQGTFAARKF